MGTNLLRRANDGTLKEQEGNYKVTSQMRQTWEIVKQLGEIKPAIPEK